jgi:aminoglycoside phosphotransferase (APT) family kinase protein
MEGPDVQNRPWTAEIAVPVELARTLVESQFPRLAPVRIELLGVGWDNTAFEINGAYIFRFPRRQIAVELLAVEARLLPWIAPRLPLAVPQPEFTGEPTESYPWPFAGYRKLPGRTACAAALDDAARHRAAEPIALFLSALHSIDVEDARQRGAGPDKFRRLDLSHQVPKLRQAIDRLAALSLIADSPPLIAIIEATPAVSSSAPMALVHGDFYVRHLLVDDRGTPTGVIDWGDIHLGHPAVDLSIAHGFLPPSAHGAFRRAYGQIADATWLLARFRALFYAVILTQFSHDTADRALLRESQVSLARLTQCPHHAPP